MITYMRREYGADVVEKILSVAANNPLPMNFSAKVKWIAQDSSVIPSDIIAVDTEVSGVFKNDCYPKINKSGNRRIFSF